jgi:hypothetical protein
LREGAAYALTTEDTHSTPLSRAHGRSGQAVEHEGELGWQRGVIAYTHSVLIYSVLIYKVITLLSVFVHATILLPPL